MMALLSAGLILGQAAEERGKRLRGPIDPDRKATRNYKPWNVWTALKGMVNVEKNPK
jgi:hypothetical protein